VLTLAEGKPQFGFNVLPVKLAQQIIGLSDRLKLSSDTPRLDAELLFAHALSMPRSKLLAKLHQEIEVPDIEKLILRRIQNEPMAYILGVWEFFSMDFIVRSPILVPRPETEHLVEAGLEHLSVRNNPKPRILDLCTGSGCVAISIARVLTNSKGLQQFRQPDGFDIMATDINPEAIALANENALKHNIALITFVGNLFDALPPNCGKFDLITANPPYVISSEWEELPPDIKYYEDSKAIISGDDGLDCLRKIILQAPNFLEPQGMLAVEMDCLQNQSVKSFFQTAGFRNILEHNDLSGRPRIVTGIYA